MELGLEVGSPAALTSRLSPNELENQGNDHVKEVKQENNEKQDFFSIISIVQNKPSNSKNNSTASLSDPETISPSLRTNLPRMFVFSAVEE